MKKIIFSAVVIASALFSQVFAQSASCDTLRNYVPGDDLYELSASPSSNGFVWGHNLVNAGTEPVLAWGERYTVAGPIEVRRLTFVPWKVVDGGGSVTFHVYTETGGLPGTSVASETVALSTFTENIITEVDFATPYSANGAFWVVMEMSYANSGDSLAILGTYEPAGGPNNTYLNTAGWGWEPIDEWYALNPNDKARWRMDVLVSNGPDPELELTSINSQSVCLGASFEVDATGSLNTDYWEWYLTDDPVTTIVDDAFTPTATLTPTAVGDHRIFLFAHGSCRTDGGSLVVYVDPVVSATVNTTNASCGQNNGEISVTNPQGGFGAYTYSLDGTNYAASSVFTNLAPGSYTVYVRTAGAGCTTEYTVTVGNTPGEEITVGTGSIVCSGDPATLSATGNGVIEWFDGTTSLGTGPSLQVNPTTTTTYTAVLTDNNNCTDQGNVTITVNALPSVTASANNTSICVGDDALLSVSGTALNYSWDQGLGAGVSFTVEPTTTTTYTVTGVDGNGCENSDAVTITVNPLDNAGFAFPNFCEGATNGATNIQTPGGSFAFNPTITDGATINASTGEITNGVLNTTYAVEYTTNGTCPNSSIVNVTVQDQDDPSFDFDDVCVGTAALPYNIATQNGTFSFATTPVDGATINGTTGEISNAVAGSTYEVVYTTPTGLCQATTSVTVAVYATPTVTISSDETICAGDEITLAASGAASFTWDQGLGAGMTHLVSPSTTTTYTATGETNGCTSQASVTITVNPVPTVEAGMNQTVCEGTSITLTATNPNGASLSWSGGVNDGVAFVPNATETYTVTATLNGCTAEDDVTITISPTPVVSAGDDLELCVYNAPVTLVGTPSGGTWSGPGVTGTSFDPNAAGNGTHTITYDYTDGNGCEGTASILIEVDACLNLEEFGQNQIIQVYPNPAADWVTITSSEWNIDALELLSAEGRVVRTLNNDNNSDAVLLNLEGIQTGVYMLRIQTNGQVVLRKLLVK